MAITPADALGKAVFPLSKACDYPSSSLPVHPGPFHSEVFFSFTFGGLPSWSIDYFSMNPIPSIPLYPTAHADLGVVACPYTTLYLLVALDRMHLCWVSPPLPVQQVFTAPPCCRRAHAHTDLLSSQGDWC